jgi:hypothetical protein
MEKSWSAKSCPRFLFGTPNQGPYDVTNEGRFLMTHRPRADSTETTDDEDEGRRTILVVNWLEELKAILGEGN